MEKISNFIVLFLLIGHSAIVEVYAEEQNSKNQDLFSRQYILTLMNQVNDYQDAHPWKEKDWSWIRSTYYTGVMALYETSHDPQVLDQAMRWAQENHWKEDTDDYSLANRLTCGQTYLQIYFLKRDPLMIAPIQRWIDSGEPGSPSSKEIWYLEDGRIWADSLYTAPPTLVMLGHATGRKVYIEYMNRMYWDVADKLFDPENHLFYRDERFIGKYNKNGKKIFWSRGNGWVIAGIPRILRYLPQDDPNYHRFPALFKSMSASIANTQGKDGLWRMNLADADEYPSPEASGTAFFCYALAWGINNHCLDRPTYLPVVKKAWTGLTGCVQESGKLGWVQKVGDRPETVNRESTHEYGVGAFLLAGSEMYKMADLPKGAKSER